MVPHRNYKNAQPRSAFAIHTADNLTCKITSLPMTVPNWCARDFTHILNEWQLRVHLEQARTDFRAMLGDIVYFYPSGVNPDVFDDEYIMSDQPLTFMYVDEDIAKICGSRPCLLSNSERCRVMATQIPPWLLSSQQLNRILQERCDEGGCINYRRGPGTNASFLAILTSPVFVRVQTDEFNGEKYGFFARCGNYTKEGEGDENEDTQIGENNEEVQGREIQFSNLIHYPIVAYGSCPLSP